MSQLNPITQLPDDDKRQKELVLKALTGQQSSIYRQHHPQISLEEQLRKTGGFMPEATQEDVDYTAAALQAGWKQGVNAVFGGIASGTLTAVEDMSYLLDMDNNFKRIAGYESVESNWLAGLMKQGKEGIDKSMPIYQRPGGFSASDSGAYWSMLKGTLDSAVGFGIPGGLIAKGTQAALKASRLSHYAKVLGGVVAEQNVGKGTAAYFMNFAEGKMMGVEAYENTLHSLENQVRLGIISPADAQMLAGQAGDNMTNLNKLMMGVDFMQLNGLFKGLGVGITRNPLEKASFRNFAKEQLKTAPSEAMEEFTQGVMQRESEYAAGVKGGLRMKDVAERIREYSRDENLYIEAAMGFFGGPAQYAITKAPFQNIKAQNQAYENQQATAKVAEDFLKTSLKNTEDIDKIVKEASDAGEMEAAKGIRKLQFAEKMIKSFEAGTADRLEAQLDEIINNPESTTTQKTLAQEYKSFMLKHERDWLKYTKYENQGDVFLNRMTKDINLGIMESYRQRKTEVQAEFNKTVAQLATSKNIPYYNLETLDENPGTNKKEKEAYKKFVAEVKALAQYPLLYETDSEFSYDMILDRLGKEILELDNDFKELTGAKAQAKAVAEREKNEKTVKEMQNIQKMTSVDKLQKLKNETNNQALKDLIDARIAVIETEKLKKKKEKETKITEKKEKAEENKKAQEAKEVNEKLKEAGAALDEEKDEGFGEIEKFEEGDTVFDKATGKEGRITKNDDDVDFVVFYPEGKIETNLKKVTKKDPKTVVTPGEETFLKVVEIEGNQVIDDAGYTAETAKELLDGKEVESLNIALASVDSTIGDNPLTDGKDNSVIKRALTAANKIAYLARQYKKTIVKGKEVKTDDGENLEDSYLRNSSLTSVKVGQSISFEIEETYVGEITIKGEVFQWQKYLADLQKDKNYKQSDSYIQNVPIKIVDDSGITLGYVHSADWLNESNLNNTEENIKKDKATLISNRESIVKGGVKKGKITEKGLGRFITKADKSLSPTEENLKDKTLKTAVAVEVGKALALSQGKDEKNNHKIIGENIINKDSIIKGVSYKIVPIGIDPNTGDTVYAAFALHNSPINTIDGAVETVVNLIEAWLSDDVEVIKKVQKELGIDIEVLSGEDSLTTLISSFIHLTSLNANENIKERLNKLGKDKDLALMAITGNGVEIGIKSGDKVSSLILSKNLGGTRKLNTTDRNNLTYFIRRLFLNTSVKKVNTEGKFKFPKLTKDGNLTFTTYEDYNSFIDAHSQTRYRGVNTKEKGESAPEWVYTIQPNIKYSLDKPVAAKKKDTTTTTKSTDTKAWKEVVTDAQYKDFIDNGIVSQARIEIIAEKIKNNEQLTPRELEIFTDKTAEINAELKALEETTTQSESTKTEDESYNAEEDDAFDGISFDINLEGIQVKTEESKLFLKNFSLESQVELITYVVNEISERLIEAGNTSEKVVLDGALIDEVIDKALDIIEKRQVAMEDRLAEGVLDNRPDAKEKVLKAIKSNRGLEAQKELITSLVHRELKILEGVKITKKSKRKKADKENTKVVTEAGDKNENDSSIVRDRFSDDFHITINHQKKASANLRRFMAGIPKMEVDVAGNKKEVRNFLGEPSKLHINIVYNTLQGLLKESRPNFAAQIKVLKAKVRSGDNSLPWLEGFIKKLEKAPVHLQNEFASNMSKHEINMFFVSYNKDANGKYYMKLVASNRSSMAKTIHAEWKDSFLGSSRSITARAEDGEFILDDEKYKRWEELYEEVKEATQKANAAAGFTGENLPEYAEEAMKDGKKPKVIMPSKGIGGKYLEAALEGHVVRTLNFKAKKEDEETTGKKRMPVQLLLISKEKLLQEEGLKGVINESHFAGSENRSENISFLRMNEEQRNAIAVYLGFSDFAEFAKQTEYQKYIPNDILAEYGIESEKGGSRPFRIYNTITPGEVGPNKEDVIDLFAGVGITLSEKGLEGVLGGFFSKRPFSDMFIEEGNEKGLLYDIKENLKYYQTKKTKNPEIGLSSNIPVDSAFVAKLAEYDSKFNDSHFVNSMPIANKTIYSYATNQLFVDRINLLKGLTRDSKLYKELLESPFVNHSKENPNNILQALLAENEGDPDQEGGLSALDHWYVSLEALKEEGAATKDTSGLSELSEKSQEVYKMQSYFRQQGKGSEVGRLVNFIMPTMSNKTRSVGVRTYNEHIRFETDGTLHEETITKLYKGIFEPEYLRMKANESKAAKDRKPGHDIFYFLPLINTAKLNDGRKLIDVLKEDGVEEKEVEAKVRELIKEYANALIEKRVEFWKKNNIGTLENGNPSFIDSNYFERISKRLIYDKIEGEDEEARALRGLEEKVRYAAADLTLNYMLFNVKAHQLIIGDPAHFYKGESVESTYDNIGKRLAMQIAPGIAPAFQEGEEYIQLIAKDYIGSSSVLQSFYNTLGIEAAKYGKINFTDAQELTTGMEHIHILHKLGRLTEREYKAISKKLKNDENLNAKELGLVLQPTKPVYTELVWNETLKSHVPVYIKSSSFPLIRQLTRGINGEISQLDSLRLAMEKLEKESGKKVRFTYESAVKTGAIDKVNRIDLWDKDGNIKEDALNFEEKNYLVLPRTGFRIQQDIPYDAYKDYIGVGTQEAKLLFVNSLDKVFIYNGKEILGKDLQKIYVENYEVLFRNERDKLERQLLTKEGKLNIPKLQELLKEEGEKRDFNDNEIEGLALDKKTGEFLIPLMYSPYSRQYQALLTSIIKNRIANQEMPGGSFVLGSSAGFKFKEAEKPKTTKFKSFEDLAPGELEGMIFTDSFDMETGLLPFHVREDGTIQPAQVIIPFKFRDNNGEILDIRKFLKQVDGKWFIDNDKLPKELLKLVGFRIPTQLLTSMDSIEIVGFSTEASGDLMVGPGDWTAQMGSDFDVDKLYAYMYETIYNKEKGTLKKVTSTKDYGEDIDEGEAFSAVSRNNIIDIHFSILESSLDTGVIQQMKAPLGYGGLDLEGNKDYKTEDSEWNTLVNEAGVDGGIADLVEEKRNVQDPYKTIISDQYQRAQFIDATAANAGVGVFSTISVLHALSQGKDMRVLSSTKEDIEVRFGELVSDGSIGGERSLSGRNYISSVIAAFQSSAVDNENRKKLGKINVNNETFDVIRAMTLLGFDEDLIALFISQDIIVDYVKEVINLNNNLETGFVEDAEEQARVNLLKGEDSLYNLKRLEEEKEDDLSLADFEGQSSVDVLKSLLELIGLSEEEKAGNKEDYVLKQRSILSKFIRLRSYGKTLQKLEKVISMDSQGVGKNLIELEHLNSIVESIEQETISIKNASNIFVDSLPGLLREYALETGKKLWLDSGLYPTATPFFTGEDGVFNELIGLLGKQDASESQKTKVKFDIFQEYVSFTLSNSETGLVGEDIEKTRKRLTVASKTNTTLGQIIETIHSGQGNISTKLKENIFLKSITSVINNSLHLLKIEAVTGPNIDEGRFLQHSLSLFLEANKEVIGTFMIEGVEKEYTTIDLGRDIIAYVYSTGVKQTAAEITKLIPNIVITTSSLPGYLKTLTPAKMRDFRNSFIVQWAQHTKNAYRLNKIGVDSIRTNLIGETSIKPENYKPKDKEAFAKRPEDIQMFTITDKNFEHSSKKFLVMDNPRAQKGQAKVFLFKREVDGTYKKIPTVGSYLANEFNMKKIIASSTAQSEAALVEVSNIPNTAKEKNLKNNLPESDLQIKYGATNENLQKGTEAAMDILENIANKSLNPFYRKIAKTLHDNNANLEAFDIVFKPMGSLYSGSFRQSEFVDGFNLDGRLTINSNKFTSTDDITSVKFEETFLHEMLHAHLDKLVNMYQNEKTRGKLTPTQLLHLENLEKLYQKATFEITNSTEFSKDYKVFKYLKAYGEKQQLILQEAKGKPINSDELGKLVEEAIILNYGKIKPSDEILSEYDSVEKLNELKGKFYGLDNLKEFIANATTSVEFMTLLNDIDGEVDGYKAGNKTLLQKIWDSIFEVLKELFPDLKRNSVLHKTLLDTLSLVKNSQKIITPAPDTLQPTVAAEFAEFAEDFVPDFEDSDVKENSPKSTINNSFSKKELLNLVAKEGTIYTSKGVVMIDPNSVLEIGNNHFGNPYTGEEAGQNFFDWITREQEFVGKEEQLRFIASQLKEGKLSNMSLLVPKETLDTKNTNAEAFLSYLNFYAEKSNNINLPITFSEDIDLVYTPYSAESIKNNFVESGFTNENLFTLWNDNKTALLNNNPDISFESFKKMTDLYGVDFVEDYIKKCKSGPKLKAKKGLTNSVKGTNWKMVKDFKGHPKHSQGGVDISISNSGVSMRRGGKDIKAAHGLLVINNN